MKPVTFTLANAGAPTPGQPPSEASATLKVGVRVLLGAETGEVYEKAQSYAREKGVAEWRDDHPLCRLYEMACSLSYAVCDVDQETGLPVGTGDKPEPFFDSVEQILLSPHVGTDNIVFLHEQWVRWQDEISPRTKKLSLDEMIGAVLVDMEAPDSPESPLLSMGHASLVSSVRSLAKLWFSSPTDKSPTSPPSGSGGPSISRSLLESGLATGGSGS